MAQHRFHRLIFYYSVRQSPPPHPEVLWHLVTNDWESLVQILHTYYMFQSKLDYTFLFNYLQLWRSYAILSTTTQFTSYAQNVHHWPKCTPEMFNHHSPAAQGRRRPTVWVKKNPPRFCGKFSKMVANFWPNFTCLLRVPIYARLWIFIYDNYLQLWWSYAILSVTTQFKSCAQNVHHRPKLTLAFSDIFLRKLGISSPNFTCLLSIHIYARIQIFIQLSPTVTKLCHIKCDHPECVSDDGGHFAHMMWTGWSRLIQHNFVIVAGNWIKICSPA